jgi:hypothetical protein
MCDLSVVIVYYIPRRKVFDSCRENNSLPRGLPSSQTKLTFAHIF